MRGCRACITRCVGVVPTRVRVCVYAGVRFMRLFERVRARARAGVCVCVYVRACEPVPGMLVCMWVCAHARVCL